MSWAPFRSTFSTISRRWRIPFACSALIFQPALPALAQQQEAGIEAVAHVLAAEDARVFDASVLRSAARNPDPAVRRHAALALGRIGDRAGTQVLLDLLADPDSVVQADAAFALGLMRDATALPRLREAILEPADSQGALARAEAVTAVAVIGGPEAEAIFEEILSRSAGNASTSEQAPFLRRVLAEGWRLGAGLPVARVVPFATSRDPVARAAAVYSLARLHAASAADVLLSAADDSVALIRAVAVRELTRDFADSAGLDASALSTRVRRSVSDPDPIVRISALRALGTYESEALASAAIERLSDPDANVRMEAMATLGRLGGATAVEVLRDHAGQGQFGFRRQALLALAAIAPADARTAAAAFLADHDWRMQAAAAEALGIAGGDSAVAVLQALLANPDGRLVATAYSALARTDSTLARDLAGKLLQHSDPVVRSLAAGSMSVAPRATDLGPLLDAYAVSLADPIPDARASVVAALGSLSSSGVTGVVEVFVRRFPRPAGYVVYREAARTFPALARRWPPVTINTGLALGDYRDIARRLVWPAEKNGALPSLEIETGRGTLTVDLLAADAPLTVNAILRLVQQRFFDGGSWHRVIPGFVAQDGDPRGDGAGGPGFTLRDEINRHRYTAGTMGIALDGPDTGGSQFFITLAPQPHLDGIYTVVGRVDSGMDVLGQIVQGDRIRRIRIQ